MVSKGTIIARTTVESAFGVPLGSVVSTYHAEGVYDTRLDASNHPNPKERIKYTACVSTREMALAIHLGFISGFGEDCLLRIDSE